jgi:hypothetical protein
MSAAGGVASWSGTSGNSSGAVSTAEGTPGSTLKDTTVADFIPMSGWYDSKFTGNAGGNGYGRPYIYALSMADLPNYAEGNPFANQTVTGRLIYHAHANGLSGKNLKGGRFIADGNPATYGNETFLGSVALDMTTKAGTVQTLEVTCGSHPDGDGNHPPCVALDPTGDETNKYAQIAGALFYIPTATFGYNLASLGTSQYTTVDDLAAIGGGGAPTCTAANFRAVLSALTVGMSSGASLVNLREHANLTAAEATDFVAGGYSVYQANLEAVLDAMDAHAVALWGRPIDCHWLRAPFQRYDNTANVGELKAAAHYAICLKRSNCCMDAYAAYQTQSNVGGTPAYGGQINTTDGIHPAGQDGTGGIKGNGDVVWMSAAWNAVAQTYYARLGTGPIGRVLRNRIAG